TRQHVVPITQCLKIADGADWLVYSVTFGTDEAATGIGPTNSACGSRVPSASCIPGKTDAVDIAVMKPKQGVARCGRDTTHIGLVPNELVDLIVKLAVELLAEAAVVLLAEVC